VKESVPPSSSSHRHPLTHPPQNYKVYCTLHNIAVDESVADATAMATAAGDMDVDMDDNDDDEDGEGAAAADGMDEDDDDDMPTFFKEAKDAEAAKDAKTPSRNPKSKVALVVKAKVYKVLDVTGLTEKRARQCDQNDFLRLLLGRFSSKKPVCCGLLLTWVGSFP
jgi:18S rRNA (adenine1779-N6/adenine1780-N6)-dimethyltransferase